jgi:hypothetical protein
VGLNPVKDIRWVRSVSPKPMELFAEGKIDAFLGFPPDPQELRARNIDRVIVNSYHRPSMVPVLLLRIGGVSGSMNGLNPKAARCGRRHFVLGEARATSCARKNKSLGGRAVLFVRAAVEQQNTADTGTMLSRRRREVP